MIQVNVVSQEQLIYTGEANMVIAPASMGEVGILPGHSPFISTLKTGEVLIKGDNSSEESIFVSGGFIEVQPKVVTILSDTAIRTEDANEERVLNAQKLAEEAMAKAKSDIDIAKAEISLTEATNRVELMTQIKDKLRKRGIG